MVVNAVCIRCLFDYLPKFKCPLKTKEVWLHCAYMHISEPIEIHMAYSHHLIAQTCLNGVQISIIETSSGENDECTCS